AAAIVKSKDVDKVYLKDPSGLLTPERVRTLVPAIKAQLGDVPLELHAHCTIGLAPFAYMAASELGVEAMHVAVGPLANGTSLPSATRLVENLREMGHRVDIDDGALAKMADYFTRLAEAEGHPTGQPRDYDAAFLRHQIPGGVITTLTRQLGELDLSEKLAAVIEETERVRAELGYPIMVTPFPQIVCTQALMNVIGPERYGNIPDQVIRYVMGRFGRPTRPVDEDIKDRILSSRRAGEIEQEAASLSLQDMRKKIGKDIGDDEFLLRAVMPAEQVDAMMAAGPAKRRYSPDSQSIVELIRELTARPGTSHVVVEKPNFRLELRKGRSAGDAEEAATDD
ncbi:MAG: biotin carboxyl carrier protein, partial [Sphingomonadales bacterium]